MAAQGSAQMAVSGLLVGLDSEIITTIQNNNLMWDVTAFVLQYY